MEKRLEISVVIPIYNEKENVEELYQQIRDALDKLNKSYEIVLVDDGSTDGSHLALQNIANDDSHVQVIRFRRNFGQTAAMKAGFDYANGDVIITMDGDLQNDPNDISKLLDKMDEGFDIVSGWRFRRQDPFLNRRLPSMIANKIISLTTQVKLHDYGCSLKAFRKDVAKNIRLYGEMHRFIPALANLMGVSVAEIPVNHRARVRGISKYGIGRTLRVILDLITVKFLLSYATRPIQIFGLLGAYSGGVGLVIAVYLSFIRLFCHQAIGHRPLLLFAVLLMMMGVQLITMGLLAEIQIRTYHESQDKPIYTVKEIYSQNKGV